jgi:hypothetical protein
MDAGPPEGFFWNNLICFVYARMHLVAGGQSNEHFCGRVNEFKALHAL